MRSTAPAAHRAVHSHQHGRHASPPPGELTLLAHWVTITASRAVPSASVLGWGSLETVARAVGLAFVFAYAFTIMRVFTRLGTLHMRTPALPNFWSSQAASRWEPPTTGASLALMRLISGALASPDLNSFDWCPGEVLVKPAVCLIGAGAFGTLLLRWSFDLASMGRSLAYAVAAGLGAAVPLLQFG